VKILFGRVRLNTEPPQEELSYISIPTPDQWFPSMIKSHIDTTTHMIETDLLWQFDIEKKYLLIGRHSQHVSRVDGDLTPPC
jgi:hypothetical protein